MLRIFYGLNRFSEDLDFTLLSPNVAFDLKDYFPILERELRSLGLHLEIQEKEKIIDSNIRSAFLKGGTKENVLTFYSDDASIERINDRELIKVKFEVDINPPPYAICEYKYGLLPSPYQVQLYDDSSLFAGKLHAVICRSWKKRIKGRDLYDYLYYLSMRTSVNLRHLQARLAESKFIKEDCELSVDDVKHMLIERFESIDYNQAKEDVYPFIKNKNSLDVWSKDFFIAVTQSLK